MIPHLFGKRHEAAGALAAWELDVSPQILENPSKVGLAASVEATHPNRRLFGLAEVGQEAAEDSFETTLVLPVADEAPKFPLKHVPLLLRLGPDDFGHTVIWNLGLGRIPIEDLAILDCHRPLLVGVIGVAK